MVPAIAVSILVSACAGGDSEPPAAVEQPTTIVAPITGAEALAQLEIRVIERLEAAGYNTFRAEGDEPGGDILGQAIFFMANDVTVGRIGIVAIATAEELGIDITSGIRCDGFVSWVNAANFPAEWATDAGQFRADLATAMCGERRSAET